MLCERLRQLMAKVAVLGSSRYGGDFTLRGVLFLDLSD